MVWFFARGFDSATVYHNVESTTASCQAGKLEPRVMIGRETSTLSVSNWNLSFTDSSANVCYYRSDTIIPPKITTVK
eukprot:3160828-Amphidinium_carterae.1